jgi:hypothetical protein
MLKRIFVDSNNQKNYCQLGRLIHGPLVLFCVGANLEDLECEWSELTASCQPVFDLRHGAKPDQHPYMLYLLELVKRTLMVSF